MALRDRSEDSANQKSGIFSILYHRNTIAIPQSNVHLSHPSTSQAYFIQTPLTDTMSNDEASMVMQINSEPSKFHPVHRGL